LEIDGNAANRKLAQIEGTSANLKRRQKQMEDEVKGGSLLHLVIMA
jgi:hypothetical protein